MKSLINSARCLWKNIKKKKKIKKLEKKNLEFALYRWRILRNQMWSDYLLFG